MAKTKQKQMPLEVATFANNANKAYNVRKAQRSAKANVVVNTALMLTLITSVIMLVSIEDFELSFRGLAAIGAIILVAVGSYVALSARKVVE